MGEKIKVTLEVEPGKHYTIKPLGEKLVERVEPGDNIDQSTTATMTNDPSGGDYDADNDY